MKTCRKCGLTLDQWGCCEHCDDYLFTEGAEPDSSYYEPGGKAMDDYAVILPPMYQEERQRLKQENEALRAELEIMTDQAISQNKRAYRLLAALSSIETLNELTDDSAFILDSVKKQTRQALRADFQDSSFAPDVIEWIEERNKR